MPQINGGSTVHVHTAIALNCMCLQTDTLSSILITKGIQHEMKKISLWNRTPFVSFPDCSQNVSSTCTTFQSPEYAIGGRSSLPLRCHAMPVHTDQCACAPMLYISELCEDCTVANEIDYEIYYAWTEPASMTTDTWSRRVTSDFYSALLIQRGFIWKETMQLLFGQPSMNFPAHPSDIWIFFALIQFVYHYSPACIKIKENHILKKKLKTAIFKTWKYMYFNEQYIHIGWHTFSIKISPYVWRVLLQNGLSTVFYIFKVRAPSYNTK